MSSKPKVSLLISCYNHEAYVEKTLLDAFNQTYKNLEIIVTDDGSTDRSPQIIQDLKTKHSFHYFPQENIGFIPSLNNMLQVASGKYIATINSDDRMALNKIETLVNCLEHHGELYAVACGNINHINEHDTVIQYKPNLPSEWFPTQMPAGCSDDNFAPFPEIIQRCYIPAMSKLIRKSALIEAGGFDEKYCTEDYPLWLKLARKYKFAYADKVLASFRLHSSNVHRTKDRKIREDDLKIALEHKDFCYSNRWHEAWNKAYTRKAFSLIKLLLLMNEPSNKIEALKAQVLKECGKNSAEVIDLEMNKLLLETTP